MKIYAATAKGPGHTEDEDRIIVGRTIINSGSYETEISEGIIAIADGVGGQNAGAVASHFLAMSLSQANDVSMDSLTEINEKLIEKSNSDDSLTKMATTLSLLHIGERKYIYHVGNTRIYNLRNGKYLRQLTTDDTSVNFLVSTGRMTDEEAETYEHKNRITACFGSGDSSLCKIKTVDITDIDNGAFVFTTDGIHDYVSLDELEEIMAESADYAEACKNAIKLAVEKGSTDDKSMIIGVL